MRRASFFVVLVLAVACGESPREVYVQGMKAEGDAERGPCKLLFDKELGQNVLSGDQVQTCLKGQEEAVALYDKAASLGLKDLEFQRTHERAQERAKRLRLMLTTIREMEAPEYPGGKVPK
jgi:hypothetical protein